MTKAELESLVKELTMENEKLKAEVSSLQFKIQELEEANKKPVVRKAVLTVAV